MWVVCLMPFLMLEIVEVLKSLAFSKVVLSSEVLVYMDLVVSNFKSFEVQVQLEALSFEVASTKAFLLKATFISFILEFS